MVEIRLKFESIRDYLRDLWITKEITLSRVTVEKHYSSLEINLSRSVNKSISLSSIAYLDDVPFVFSLTSGQAIFASITFVGTDLTAKVGAATLIESSLYRVPWHKLKSDQQLAYGTSMCNCSNIFP